MYLNFLCLLHIILICNLFNLASKDDSKVMKLTESDSVYFQDIRNVEYSPNKELYVVNQASKSNRISVFTKNHTLYKSYLIDDSYTFKFLDSIYYNKSELLINSDYYNNLQGSKTNSEFLNTISQSTFLNDSILITIGTLKYLVHYNDTPEQPHFKRNNVTIVFIINLNTNEFQIKPLRFNETKVNPQSTYLEIVDNELYFELFPSGFLRKVPDSPKFVVGKIDLNSHIWEPIVELPIEYITSNIRLRIGFSYRISDYYGTTYFMSPLTNYLFNIEKDTIILSDLVDPILFSLNKFNSKTVSLPKEMFKLDSISHSIVDFFFHEDFLYVVLNKPIDKDGKIYLHKYTLNGKFLKSRELNNGKKLETAFYSKNKRALFKVYLENEEWYLEEVDFY